MRLDERRISQGVPNHSGKSVSPGPPTRLQSAPTYHNRWSNSSPVPDLRLAPVDANSSVGEQVPLQRITHVTHPIWKWRHDPNVVKVRDEVFSLFLLSCLQCAMLTQRAQQRHQRSPCSLARWSAPHLERLPKDTSATRRTCGRTEWPLHRNVHRCPGNLVVALIPSMDITVEFGFNSHNP